MNGSRKTAEREWSGSGSSQEREGSRMGDRRDMFERGVAKRPLPLRSYALVGHVSHTLWFSVTIATVLSLCFVCT